MIDLAHMDGDPLAAAIIRVQGPTVDGLEVHTQLRSTSLRVALALCRIFEAAPSSLWAGELPNGDVAIFHAHAAGFAVIRVVAIVLSALSADAINDGLERMAREAHLDAITPLLSSGPPHGGPSAA